MADKFEPVDFFEHLKSTATDIELETVQKGLDILKTEYQKSMIIGQKNMQNTLSAMHDVLIREVTLINLGYKKSISREAVAEFIKKVTPANSVRAVELKAFPRVIPDVNAAAIKKAVNLKIFDDVIIVYTDFTDKKAKTKEQQAVIARNRDPIAFGVFHNEKLDFRHDRMYVITDWVDEFCDLTFDKMLSEMIKSNQDTSSVNDFKGNFTVDKLEKLIRDNLKEATATASVNLQNYNPGKKSLFSKLKKVIFGDS